MDCHGIVAEMDAFLDGELPRGRSAEMRRHLDGCPACASRAGLRKLAAASVREGYRETGPSQEARTRILTAVRRQRRRGLLPPAAGALLLAASVMLAVASGLVLRMDSLRREEAPRERLAILAGHHDDCWGRPCGERERQAGARWLERHADAAAALPAPSPGAAVRDVRLCAAPGGGEMLHVLWNVPSQAGGEAYRVSLYAAPGPGAEGPFPGPGVRGVAWERAGWQLALVSDAPPEVLERLARAAPRG